ncbi:TPA: hypothetical protein I7253_15020 [Vibrio vulnificus]|nr:hypothetical protein [Vibrio vulnificus]
MNTDIPEVEGIDLPFEYKMAAPQVGLSPEQIRQAQLNGLTLSFLSEADKEMLKQKTLDNSTIVLPKFYIPTPYSS